MESAVHTLRKIIIGGVFMTPFVVLLFLDQFYFPFITSKAFTFRIIIEILLLLWLILLIYEPRYRPRFSWLLAIIASFLLVIGLSNLLAEDGLRAFWSNFERMEGYVTLIHLFAYFVIAGTMLNTEKLWLWFYHMWLGVGAFLGLYGLLQAVGELPSHMGGGRIDATLGNSAYLASVMVFLIFFVIYYAVRNKNDLVPIIVSSSIATSLFIVHTFLTYNDRLEAVRAQGTNVAVDFFGGDFQMFLFVVSLVILGGGAYFASQRSTLSDSTVTALHTAFYAVFGILFAIVLLFTKTRGAILGVFVGLSLMVILIALFARARPKLQRVMSVLSLLGILIGIVFGIMVITNTMGTTEDIPVIREVYSVAQTIPGLARVSGIELGETTVRSRFMVWRIASQGVADKPMLGWGQGNFPYVFERYYDPRMFDQEPWFDRAHNIMFDWLISGGVVGAFMYFAIYVFALFYIWYDPDRGFILRVKDSGARVLHTLQRFNKGGYISPRASSVMDNSIFTGLVVAYLFHNFFVFDNLASYLLFFSLLAFIYAIHTPDENKIILGTYRVSEQTKMIVASFLVIASIPLMFFVNIRPIQANTGLLDAIVLNRSGRLDEGLDMYKKILSYETFGNTEIRAHFAGEASSIFRNEKVPPNIKDEYYRLAMIELQKQMEETSRLVRPHLNMGSFFVSVGRYEEALTQFEIAHDLSPKKQDILFQLANVYMIMQDNENALKALKEAFYLEPRNINARGYYLQTALIAEDEESIQDALTYGEDKEVSHFAMSDQIVNAYISTKKWVEVEKLLNIRIETIQGEAGEELSLREAKLLDEHYEKLVGVYANMGNLTVAMETAKEAQKLFPSHSEKYQNMIDQIQAGQKK